MENQNLILVGSIIGIHGLKGYVKIKSFLENPNDIFKFNEFLIKDKKFNSLSLKFSKKSYMVCELSGIHSITESSTLSDSNIFIKRSSLPKIKEDEIYLTDLINFNVELDTGRYIGKVFAYYNFGAGPIIEVTYGNDKRMLPISKIFILNIDQKLKTITLSSNIKSLLS